MAGSHEQTGSLPPEEVTLSHQSIEIPTDNPLVSLEESQRQFELNAAVVAEIKLPVENSTGTPKMLRLLDFGADLTDKGKAIFYMPEVGAMRHMGTSRTRFALAAANYRPDTHMIGFCELPTGSTTVGRDALSHTNHWLGLSDTVRPSQHNEANRALSRKQFTIEVSEQGTVKIEDHSANGTTVKLH